MGIGGIGDYGNPLQDCKVSGVQEKNGQKVNKQTISEEPAQAVNVPVQEAPSDKNRNDAHLEDISITFNRQEEFGYIGQDKDIRSLDMDKAISEMRKDQVLQQYQYFVGSSRNLHISDADGTVIRKF